MKKAVTLAVLLCLHFRARSGTRAARATGGSYRPVGIRLEPPGGQYRRKILLPGHAGGSGAAHTKGDYGGPVV